MALILHLETSTKICSVALSNDGTVLFSRTEVDGPSHAVKVGLFVDEALKVAEEKRIELIALKIKIKKIFNFYFFDCIFFTFYRIYTYSLDLSKKYIGSLNS